MPTTNYYLESPLDYFQNKSPRYFGELDERVGSNVNEEILLDQLKRICDRDSHFLLSGKLFSRVITKKMIKFDEELQDDFRFQQKLLFVFKHIYEDIRRKGINQKDSEIRAAKIIWNLMEENKFEDTALGIIKDRNIDPNLTRDNEFIEKYNVKKNLVEIVQRPIISKMMTSSTYQETSNLVNKGVELYRSKKYRQMIVIFELALRKIQEFEGKESAAIFATILGTLLIQKTSNVSKGLYFLKRGEKFYEELNDKTMYIENLGRLAEAFWSLGMYKRALDKLSTEVYLHTMQKNELSIINSQEKLSHFFYYLSRYIESQEWALNFLNSSVRSTNETFKAYNFLNANIDYARTLIGLNAWPKAEAHLSYAQRALSHIETFDDEFINDKSLEIRCMQGIIAVARGNYDLAKTYFAARKTDQGSSVFLRAEANMYRHQRNFSQAIKVLQPLFQEKETVNPKNISLLAELLALHSHEKEALKLLNHAIEVLFEWNSIHGLSRTYLSKGYIYLLMDDFKESKKWYTQSLEITGTDLVDLKVSIDAHLNLAYMALENGNLKKGKKHLAIAEECASMSGSLAFLLDSQLLKANLKLKQGEKATAEKIIRRIASEARDLEIDYIAQKAGYLLNNL